MTQEPEHLSPLAAELARLVALSNGKRVRVNDLFDGASRFDPGLVGDPAARSRFRDALDELQAAGRITMPTTRSRTGWDLRVMPPVPAWVMRISDSAAPVRRPAVRVWPSALEAAARIATRADEHALLERIAAWLRDNPSADPAPAEERSLDIFDDEKAIEGYLKTRLFTSGALTLDLLACYLPPLPFASQHIDGAGDTRLIAVENLATYTSLLTAIRELDRDTRPDVHVAWGVGGAFTQSVLSIPMLDPQPARAYYFGDLDVAGLSIAVKAAERAQAAGLPKISPAVSLYEFLLTGPQIWRTTDDTYRQAAPDYEAACNWFPRAIQPQVKDLLISRKRIPQERLSLRVLRQTPELSAWLAP